MEQKKILVAVDGSEYSFKVLDKSIEIAKLLSALVVFVYCHKKYPRLMGHPYRDQMISAIKDETESVVRPFLNKLLESRVEFIERLMEEPAGSMISEVAQDEGCEMIVMGSRGLSNLQGLIIGSVTHRVLHTATCPVLVVK